MQTTLEFSEFGETAVIAVARYADNGWSSVDMWRQNVVIVQTSGLLR
jgi:hypothetical protein